MGAGVTGQPATDISTAMDEVDNAVGHPFVVQDLHQAGCGARGEIAGLDNRGATDRQRERQLLGNDQEGNSMV